MKSLAVPDKEYRLYHPHQLSGPHRITIYVHCGRLDLFPAKAGRAESLSTARMEINGLSDSPPSEA